MPLIRRALFVFATGCTALAAAGAAEPGAAPPEILRPGLAVRFQMRDGRLRQTSFLPPSVAELPATLNPQHPDAPDPAAGVEVEFQATGENWDAHHADKLIGGNPGASLLYAGQSEGLEGPDHVILAEKSRDGSIAVESHYRFYGALPVARRWTRVRNLGRTPVGIEHVSSAMVYGLADRWAQDGGSRSRIYYADSSWQCEGQWHGQAPTELGLQDDRVFNLNAVAFTNVGSWSSMSYLPMGMFQDRTRGVTWFWQIEHDGAWHWEISNTFNRTSYLYLGGPDELFSQAWKNLRPGADYETVPAAVGCVRGGFDQAVAALTRYRRAACLQPHPDDRNCPVQFNDYMNCLLGDPTAEKEAPLIAAAARAGCEYFVIDAGWYAERNENWFPTVGAWQPSRTRWGRDGLGGVMRSIREHGMIPGLWLEIEVAGIDSPLRDKPDRWFFLRHGRRVIDQGRYFLDFRQPAVRAYADGVVDRLVRDYGIGYIKFDYNVDALLGTETAADSLGQGLLEHQRAYLRWIDGLHARYPDLVLENCGSGGGREDYAILAHHQIQSSSDERDYRLYPAIVTGSTAAVLPEQLGVWAYPTRAQGPDAASFNLVNAMLVRIVLSGELADLSGPSAREVADGIRLYKQRIRPEIPQMVPFYPLGLPRYDDARSPVALGMAGPRTKFVAVWRLEGEATVSIPLADAAQAKLLYPTDLGIEVRGSPKGFEVRFPRADMAAIVEIGR